MYIILNQAGKTIGFIQNQFIMDQTKENILGILIGDCFFGKQQSIVGKIFNATAYLVSGEIVGKIVLDTNYKGTVPKKSHMLEAWDILSNVKNHTSTWIVETNNWSKKSLQEHLS